MKKIVFFGLIFLFTITACDSSLSDMNISDPSIISPDIRLTRLRDENDKLSTSIEVFLWDKNLSLVKLKKGSIHVNGHIMTVKEFELIGGPYYTIDESIISVELNKFYDFTIELADGKKYRASIRTQDIDLHELNLPTNYKKTDNMEINWKNKDTKNELEIQLNCDYVHEIESGFTSDKFIPHKNESSNCKYVIPKYYFNQEKGIYKASITIMSKKSGKIDSHFRSNVGITSSFEKISDCSVY